MPNCKFYVPGCNCGSCVRWRWRQRKKRSRRKVKTVFDAIELFGHDEDFVPQVGNATDAAPGSAEKIAVMRSRVDRGETLFHPDDRSDCDGLYADAVRVSYRIQHATRQRVFVKTFGNRLRNKTGSE